MRSMLDNLRDDLGIDSHDSYRESSEDVGMGSSRPAVRSKTKTTGYTGDASQFTNVRVGSAEPDKNRGYGDVADGYRHLGSSGLEFLIELIITWFLYKILMGASLEVQVMKNLLHPCM